MEKLPVSRKVVFLHVQKTGGITFRRILSSIYGEAFHFCSDPSVDAVARALKEFDCLELHMANQAGNVVCSHSELARQGRWDLLCGADIFCMFRDPVDQAVSLYYYLLEMRDSAELYYKAMGMPFPESLQQYVECDTHFNNQLRFLVDKLHLTTKLTREDLAKAKDLLASLRVHLGLTERYGDSLHVFESVTRQCIPGRRFEIHNRTPNRPSLSQIPRGVINRIREQSALDIELYDFGRGLLEEDMRRYGPAPAYSFSGPSLEAPRTTADTNQSRVNR